MKFLIDNAISQVVAEGLRNFGFDAVHVGEIGIQHAEDEMIFQRAFDDERTIISGDTDFGTLLSAWQKEKPSVIVFRKRSDRDPIKQLELLKANLNEPIIQALNEGSIVIIELTRIRMRKLPIF
jgi:predicted nuclease of predicted toxin-antitoxin system